MIYASQQLIHGYRVYKLISCEGKFIWKHFDYSDNPLLIELPSNREEKLMRVDINFRNDFYYLDFFESDLSGN